MSLPYHPERPRRQPAGVDASVTDHDERFLVPYSAWKCGGAWSRKYM
jgi:hypothetical protein